MPLPFSITLLIAAAISIAWPDGVWASAAFVGFAIGIELVRMLVLGTSTQSDGTYTIPAAPQKPRIGRHPEEEL